MDFEAATKFWANLPPRVTLSPRLDDVVDLHSKLLGKDQESRGEGARGLRNGWNFVRLGNDQSLWFCRPTEVRTEYEKLLNETSNLMAGLNLGMHELDDAQLLARVRFVAYFHARLIYIHPFRGGNGRLARFISWEHLRILFPGTAFVHWEGSDRLRKSPNGMGAEEYLAGIKAAPLNLLYLAQYFCPVKRPTWAPYLIEPPPSMPRTIGRDPPP